MQPRHGLAHLPPDCPCPAGAAGTYADIQGEAGGRNERGGRWWSKLTVAGILSELALTSTESFVKHILTNVYVHIHFCSEKLVIFPKIHFVLQNVKISIWSITTFMSCHQVSCDMLRLSCDMSHIS